MVNLGNILVSLITIYMLILIFRIFLSIVNLPYSRFIYYLCKITDPVLDFFRKKFPLRIGNLDFSVVIPFILLSIIQRIITDLMIHTQPFNFYYILGLLISIIHSIIFFILTFLFIATIVLLIINRISPYNNNLLVNTLRMFILPMIIILKSIIHFKSAKTDTVYYIILVLLILLVGLLTNIIFFNLLNEIQKSQGAIFLRISNII